MKISLFPLVFAASCASEGVRITYSGADSQRNMEPIMIKHVPSDSGLDYASFGYWENPDFINDVDKSKAYELFVSSNNQIPLPNYRDDTWVFEGKAVGVAYSDNSDDVRHLSGSVTFNLPAISGARLILDFQGYYKFSYEMDASPRTLTLEQHGYAGDLAFPADMENPDATVKTTYFGTGGVISEVVGSFVLNHNGVHLLSTFGGKKKQTP